MEEFTRNIEKGTLSEKEIQDFIYETILPNRIEQQCFMSTAIEPSAVENFAKRWEICADLIQDIADGITK